MELLKKLPDAEFEVMKVVWNEPQPINANTIMLAHGDALGWKVQTAITLLNRLVERGFLSTQKQGKMRTFTYVVTQRDYLNFETGNFVKQFHSNSLLNLVSAMYDDEQLSDNDIDELMQWAKDRRKS